jgi:hypothetical protein
MDLTGHAGWPRPPAATTAAAALQLARQMLVEHGWCQRIARDGERMDAATALAIACGLTSPRPERPTPIYLEALDLLADAMDYQGEQQLDVLILTNDCATSVEQVLDLFDRAAAAALPIPAVSR